MKLVFLLIFFISIIFASCYPLYEFENGKSYYFDKSGNKHYVKLYYKGYLINKKGKNLIDSVVEIKN